MDDSALQLEEIETVNDGHRVGGAASVPVVDTDRRGWSSSEFDQLAVEWEGGETKD
jgi:hypothetical protein